MILFVCGFLIYLLHEIDRFQLNETTQRKIILISIKLLWFTLETVVA